MESHRYRYQTEGASICYRGIANHNARSGPQGSNPQSSQQTGRLSVPLQRWLHEKEKDGPYKGPQPQETKDKDGQDQKGRDAKTGMVHDDGESKVGQCISLSLQSCLM